MPTPGNIPAQRRRERGHGRRNQDSPARPGQINTQEEITPRRLWLLARKAVECGWTATVHPADHPTDGPAFQLILTERNHCIHVLFVERPFDGKRWNVKRNIVRTRCPAAEHPRDAEVRLSQLTEYLEVHPGECETLLAFLGERPDLWDRVEAGQHQGCDYHLPMRPWGVKSGVDNEERP